MKKIFFIICFLLVHPFNLFAKEYINVEDIFNDSSFNISKMGYPGNKKGCQEFINNWIEKLTEYTVNEPSDARAYLYRGYFYGFKPTCWKYTDSVMKAQGRDEYLESDFLKKINIKMNSDWNSSLVMNEKTKDNEKKLSWFMLDRIFSVFMTPEVVEKKEKLRIKMATPENLGAGTDHPVDKSTFILKQYERMADKYNYTDDRENVTRILNELSVISPEGAEKSKELKPQYKKSWEKRDSALSLNKKEVVKKDSKSEPKKQMPIAQSELPKPLKPVEQKTESAPEIVDSSYWYLLSGVLILLAVIGVLAYRRR